MIGFHRIQLIKLWSLNNMEISMKDAVCPHCDATDIELVTWYKETFNCPKCRKEIKILVFFEPIYDEDLSINL